MAKVTTKYECLLIARDGRTWLQVLDLEEPPPGLYLAGIDFYRRGEVSEKLVFVEVA